MATIEECLKAHYRMEIEKDIEEGGYVVSFPDLPGCITCADSLEGAVLAAENAKREWIAAAFEEGIEVNLPQRIDDYSGQFKLRIPRSLHKRLAEGAKREGISMNQYCLYLLTRNDVLASRA